MKKRVHRRLPGRQAGAARKAHGGAGASIGVILERFKRLKALPAHPLDWESEFFMTHFLGVKKSAML